METFLSPLSVAEEKDCLIRLRNGDSSAREELILHNMRLVAHVAKRYLSTEEDPEDLISIGTIGLIKAVSTFDREYGSRFATYAIRCIDNEMLMFFRSRKKQKCEVSLYDPIGTDKEGNQIHLFDVLESEEADVCETIEKRHQIARLYVHMTEVLTPREYEIIQKRYGLFGQREQTQREIAATTGISRSYVSRMEKKALEKLKIFLKE